MKNKNLAKRLVLGSVLGVMFGTLCFAGFSSNANIPEEMARWQVWSWNNAMMWGTIINRMLLGVVVALAGFITVSPICGVKIPTFFRGIKMGFLVSLPMAIGSLVNSNPEVAKGGFWIVLIAGTIIGMIIDLVITRLAGDGDELVNKS